MTILHQLDQYKSTKYTNVLTIVNYISLSLKMACKPKHVREISYNNLLLKYLCTLLEYIDPVDIVYIEKYAVKRDSYSLIWPNCIEIK
jgi:hypothetical protein